MLCFICGAFPQTSRALRVTELAPSCTARSSLIMSAKRLHHAYERMPIDVDDDSDEVSASRQQPAANNQRSDPPYPNNSLQDAPLTKKRGRPPTDPAERAKWEQHQKAVEKARLAAEAAGTALPRRQNQPTAAGVQGTGFNNEMRYKQKQDQPTAGAVQQGTEKRYKQMTFLQPKPIAPLGVNFRLPAVQQAVVIAALTPHVFCRSLLEPVTCWPRWARRTLLYTTSRSA